MRPKSEIQFDFHSEDISFELIKKPAIISWLSSSIKNELKSPGEISYIFCSDNFLHEMNKKYLNHDTLTDIITFDYCEDNVIHGDMFISIDRVTYNADTFGCTFIDELHRVMIHGLMHLCGYQDKTLDNQVIMKKKEDFYLALRSF
jgi:rRNA maturation RNase YbeY